MFIKTENEIKSLMPTAMWKYPQQLYGYIEEEERVALEPLLGTVLYQWLLGEYDRLLDTYGDITATTIRPTGKARTSPEVPYADVTERIEHLHSGAVRRRGHGSLFSEDYDDVPVEDLQTIRLIRICQQIEFYKMISHKAGLLTVSFNDGGGMNTVSADGYDEADERAKDRVVKDAWMSAGRSVDSLLLFLEADAKGERLFTEKWQEADAYYLHQDLLFQTARVLNEYLPVKGERMAYVELVRDIRYCQNTYLKPRIGAGLLKAVVEWANQQTLPAMEVSDNTAGDTSATPGEDVSTPLADREGSREIFDELLSLLRTALAFYVESRRMTVTSISPFSVASSRSSATSSYQKEDRLARRDSMTDAQQSMAMACAYIEEHLDALGQAAVGTPIYNAVRAREEQAERERACACAAAERRRSEACKLNGRKLFTGFPATHRTPERS